MVRNCWFPEVGTPGSQPGNRRLPLQATAGSQRLELLVPNLGTIGYHCNQLLDAKDWNSGLPTWQSEVTIARNYRFPEVGPPGSQPRNHRVPLQATAGSQTLKLTLPNLGPSGSHWKQLPLPTGWNLCFRR